jgi:uncharacterized LabA/DUF88 family protein
MRQKEQRVGIFIDVQNLYHSAKNLYRARVNFKELVKNVTAGRKLIRAIAYVVKTESTEGESAFFDALKDAGIELRVKDIQIFAGGAMKADWDVGMAVDAIRMSDFLDVVALVTGDGDFLPLIDYLKWGKGRVVEVASFSRTGSGKMKEVADLYIPIEEIPKVLLKK